MLYDYCASHGIAHRKCGKLIVATNAAEAAKVEAIHAQGRANGVEGLEMIGGNAARALEPEIFCIAALHSRESGIIDGHAYMLALRGDFEDRGGMIAFGTPVERLTPKSGGWQVRFGGAEPGVFAVDAVVNCAGLGAQALARQTDDYPPSRVPRLVLAKGNYFGYSGRPVFSRLIYPTPVDGGLGTHVTLDLAGRMRFGPDVEWIAEENYNVDRGPRAIVLRAHPHLLARPSRRHARSRLRRHPAKADRSGRAGGRFHDRRPGRAWPAGTWCSCLGSSRRG